MREPDPDDPDAELRRPHPITPAHERIFKENNMLGALNAAMDLGNVAELRRLNREYREQYPEDSHVMQEGYDIIADCLERRTAANRIAAETSSAVRHLTMAAGLMSSNRAIAVLRTMS